MKNTSDKATPRPWNFGIHGENRILIHAKNINDGWIADCGNKFEGGVNFENAELIVRAVNNFDGLIKACKKSHEAILSLIKFYPENMTGKLMKAIELCEQAIANAEEK